MENNSQRLHGLDAYRATLMVLGVVIHTALVYGMSGVIDSIHTFRMPAFYLLSGYFGALLFYKYGLVIMLKNRIKRLLYPFIVLVFVFFPINTFFWTYLDNFNRGVVEPLVPSLNFTLLKIFPPTDTMHFWFLYHLIFVILIVIGVVKLMERFSYSSPNVTKRLKGLFERGWSFMAFIGLINFLWFTLFTWTFIPTDAGWFPNLIIISYYTLFYSLGWLIFTIKVDLLSFTKNAWLFLVIGLFCSIYYDAFDHLFYDYNDKIGPLLQWKKVFWFLVKNLMSSVALACWVRGLLGIFLKYCSGNNKIWRYVSDSSYWVFIFHITLCPLSYILFSFWQGPTLIKFIVSIPLVFFVCLLSYDGFIRSTFIGKFLNGRSYQSFQKGTSITLCFIMSFGCILFLNNPPSVLERPSPWANGKNPSDLLPNKKIVYPFIKSNMALSGVSTLRCAKVGGYVVCPDGVKFEDAKKACLIFGGKMASFENKDKYDKVIEWLPKILKRRVWLAVRDSKKEGTWVWENKKTLDYDHWIENRPDNWKKTEDCAEIQLWRKKPGWNDMPCGEKLGFICKLE